MALDLMGNISLIISVIVLFMLVLGLPLVRGINNKQNLMRHGYLTIAALVLQTVLVLVVMIPSILKGFDSISSLPLGDALDIWLHAVLGVVAEVAGLWFIALWLVYSRSRMRCVTAKRYMAPSLVVWIIAVVTGALIHLLQML